MRKTVRWCVAAAMIASLCDFPAMAAAGGASEKPLGVVVVAEHARFAGANAAAGTTVYAGDAFDTEDKGTLCLRVGTGQVFLLADSAAEFGRDAGIARLVMTRGIAVFSAPTSGQFEVETPAGMLRGVEGKPLSGRVELRGPQELVIAASGGDLVLDNDGELHTIAAGKAVRVVIEDADASASAEQDNPPSPQRARRRRKLAFYIIFAGAVGGISAGIFYKLSESPYRVQ